MKVKIILSILIMTPFLLLAQSPETANESALNDANSISTSTQQKTAEPWGFTGIQLGMDMQTVEAMLEKSAYFIYDSKRISWLPFSPLISAKGRGMVSVGHFHFVDNKLYSINLVINSVKMDFFTLMRQLNEKYGKYFSLNPSRVQWKGENSSISLEKPLTVTYLDAKLHELFVSQSMVEESKVQERREIFLEQF